MDSIAERFRKVSIAIVGDVMLDRYWWGTVDRISPEAPVPVVKLERSTFALGGAANVAANVAGLGAKPFLIGCRGSDEEGGLVCEQLSSASIESRHLTETERPTPVKTRIVAHNQHVVRVDRETIDPLDALAEAKLIEKLQEIIPEVDLVIVSDYAKGTLTTVLLEHLIRTATKAGKRIVVDPKGKDYTKYRGASVLTPNRREALDACGLEIQQKDAVQLAGRMLMESLDLEALVITRGDEGMTLFQPNGFSRSLKAETHEIYDVTGAGDTVIACLGVALAAGLSFIDSVQLANTAASLVVEQVGTTAISIDMLINFIQRKTEGPPSGASITSA